MNKYFKKTLAVIFASISLIGCSNQSETCAKELFIESQLTYYHDYMDGHRKITCWADKKGRWLSSTNGKLYSVSNLWTPYEMYNDQKNYGITLQKMGELLRNVISNVSRKDVELVYLFDDMGYLEWDTIYFGPNNNFGKPMPPKLEDYVYTELGL